MSQEQQFKKAKKFRIAKVVFYFLGLPFFVFAVFLTALKYIGNAPFTGHPFFLGKMSIMIDFETLISSPALYGLWLAVAVWLFISIVHIILSKTVKNRRVRMFTVLAVVLVVMLGGTLVMDVALEAKVSKIAAEAPEGVSVPDYKNQLSYYRMVSSNKKRGSTSYAIMDKVKQVTTAYNIGFEGGDSSGAAGSMNNKPVSYFTLISDPDENGECQVGVDISSRLNADGFWELDYEVDANGNYTFKGDGKITKEVEGKQLVRLEPNKDGYLVINGKKFSHYFFSQRGTQQGKTITVWYTKEMMPQGFEFDHATGARNGKKVDGPYGKGTYMNNGLLPDGWTFGLMDTLYILEDYYEAQEVLGSLKFPDNEFSYNDMVKEAKQRRDDYYNGLIAGPDGKKVDPWITALYNQEAETNIPRFSLTKGDLDMLVSKVGALLGNNALFDYLLLDPNNLNNDLEDLQDLLDALDFNIGEILGPILQQLSEGMSLKELIGKFVTDTEKLDNIMNIVCTVFEAITGKPTKDIYINLAYKSKNAFGEPVDNLYLAVIAAKDDGEGHLSMGGKEDILLDIDFRDAVIDPVTGEYVFDIDHLSKFLTDAVNNALNKYGNVKSIVNTVVNLLGNLGILVKDIDVEGPDGETLTYKGIAILGFDIPLIAPDGKFDIDISSIALKIVESLYFYTSAVFKPVWEFYVPLDPAEIEQYERENPDLLTAYRMYAQMERAYFEGAVYGKMIGSTLIGDSIGTGNYSSSFGFTSLAAVRQMMVDLSYMPTLFPILGFRDMMIMLSGMCIFFYFVSFVCADKEEMYATGKGPVKLKRRKKSKKGKKTEEGSQPVQNGNAEVKSTDGEAANEGAAVPVAAAGDAQPAPPQATLAPDGGQNAAENIEDELILLDEEVDLIGDAAKPEAHKEAPAVPVNENTDKEVRS